MQNQVSPQYIQNQNLMPQTQAPQAPQAMQPCCQTYPAPSVGAVNIQIFNPTANPAPGFYQTVPCGYYPCNYNNMTVQPPMPQNSTQQQINPSTNGTLAAASMDPNQMNMNQNQNGVAAQGDGKNGAVSTQQENKPKVPLTDDYIKTLENYLNSQDKKIRLMGAKELLDRFKEDETRKEDPALTALLNKILQDPAETVKFVGLTALDAGYAKGDNNTAQILNQMQASSSSYGEDAALASKVLLQMSRPQAEGAQAPQVQSAEQTNKDMVDPSLAQNQTQQNGPQNDLNNLNKIPNDGGVLMTANNNQVAGNATNNQAV